MKRRRSTPEIPHPFLIQVGKNINKLREEKGWSLEELADNTRLTKSQVHRIEKGYNITLLTLLRFAIAFKINPDRLLLSTSIYTEADLELISSLIRKKQ